MKRIVQPCEGVQATFINSWDYEKKLDCINWGCKNKLLFSSHLPRNVLAVLSDGPAVRSTSMLLCSGFHKVASCETLYNTTTPLPLLLPNAGNYCSTIRPTNFWPTKYWLAHLHGLKQYLSFRQWLILLHIMTLRLIHVIEFIRISSDFKTEQHFIYVHMAM